MIPRSLLHRTLFCNEQQHRRHTCFFFLFFFIDQLPGVIITRILRPARSLLSLVSLPPLLGSVGLFLASRPMSGFK